MSKILIPKFVRRRGVSIIEVLFAIMVTSIGVLAALTLLPVAATQAKRARTADASATAVTAATGFFDARGMRRPQSWIAYNWGTGQPVFPWTEFQNNLSPWFDGSESFCIDPRMIAANLQNPPSPLLVPPSLTIDTTVTPNRAPASTFPRGADARPLVNLPFMWRLSIGSGLAGMPVPPQVPPRVPVPPPLPMSKLMADSVFVFDDDLNYDRADDATLVAGQIFDTLPATGELARRRIDGHLSWMATLTPKLERYAGSLYAAGLGHTPLNNTYVLSVVVFHDRPADMTYNADAQNERVLEVAAMPGGGVTGGEVLLTWTPPATPPANVEEIAQQQLNIQSNQWIMLMGTLPSARIGERPDPVTGNLVPVATDPIHVFKWYRVSDTEAEITFNGTSYERYVTLMGQDWPAGTNINGTSLPAQAVVMEGVVAVMERTIRLEL